MRVAPNTLAFFPTSIATVLSLEPSLRVALNTLAFSQPGFATVLGLEPSLRVAPNTLALSQPGFATVLSLEPPGRGIKISTFYFFPAKICDKSRFGPSLRVGLRGLPLWLQTSGAQCNFHTTRRAAFFYLVFSLLMRFPFLNS